MIGALVAGITGSGGASLSSYESIATATGTGSSGTITFSSIPSGFKHLQIRGIARSSYAAVDDNLYIYPNGSTSSVYSWHYLAGEGTTALASGAATQSSIFNGYAAGANATANQMGVFIIDILDYGSTSKYKTTRTFTGLDRNGAGYIWIMSGLYQVTSAITSLDIKLLSGNFTTASTFALYGIKEA